MTSTVPLRGISTKQPCHRLKYPKGKNSKEKVLRCKEKYMFEIPKK
jgi:hypothetical protein